jgi:hypothetical protein
MVGADDPFLRRCLSFFAARGVHVERVMTDNGSVYRSAAWALATRALGIRATCAPGRDAPAPTAKPNASSAPCSTAGPRRHLHHQPPASPWPPRVLHYYNHQRPRGSLAHQPPAESPQAEQVPRNYN